MNLGNSTQQAKARRRASVLIVVLWVAIGLVSIALYFAHSMTFEFRASDNRASGIISDQAIEGAARYVAAVLTAYATNGAMPIKGKYACDNVPIGDAHFWIIGRDPSGTLSTEPYFGLIDEGSKLSLNRAGTNALYYLGLAVQDMTSDFALAITDWRNTNGTLELNYAQLGYEPKHDLFETVDELRLVDGATVDLLVGNDINRNGVIDANEKGDSTLGSTSSGLFEYLTVYSREPNYHSDGSSLTNVTDATQLRGLLEANFGSTRADQIMRNLGFTTGGQQGGGGGGNTPSFNCLLDFYLAAQTNSQMTQDEFAKIYNDITVGTNVFFRGRVNVNTASEAVLTALFMSMRIDQNTASGAAQTLISYREQHPDTINTVAWVVDALGANNQVVQALADRNIITTKTFQFAADIAAVGPYGRGYRRVKFIFDISEGTPKILYRQDLTRLGWALGEKARKTYFAANTQ